MTPASRRLALSRTALVVSCAVALTMAPGADAGSRLNVSTLAKVAGRSPFPASCSAGFAEYHHAESEVSLAVDPTNGRHLIATYHQDANVAHPVSRSVDGGRTWRQVVVPGLTPCSVPKGEKAPAYNVFDPWVTYGADGRAYLLSVSGTEPGSPGATVAEPAGQQDPFAKHVYVQTSDDDGLTWSAPVVVAGDVDNGFLIDKPTITADPFRPGRAHAVWSRVNLTGSAVMGVATTVDGGRTWSARTLPLTTLDTRGVTFGGQIVVQRDGMLVMTFAEGMAQPLFIAGTLARNASGVDSIPSFIGNARFYSITSADGGATWATRGQLIGSSQTFPGLITVASAGAAIHATWADLSADGIGRVQVSRSLDNGATWSPPLTLAGPGPGVDVPAVAVDGKGTVAVTWYAAGPAPRTVQSVAAVSTDAGVTWTKAALSRAFSVASAPPTNAAGGTQLGDYEGLAGLPAGGFVSAFTVAGALSRGGPTDVVAVRFGR
ncbi:MAG TPA: sialidase family protein [Mycobacteriales bacterium]|nr:sialidase family protein [Mycobacteriales bacterium]